MNKNCKYGITITIILMASCNMQNVDDGYYCDEQLDELNLCAGIVRPDDSYNYPVRPCMNQWKELTGQQMKEVCQIPENTAKSMSTQALIQSCWEYPFFVDIAGMYRSDMKLGEDILSDFNGYIELKNRQDAGLLLKERYVLLDPLCERGIFYLNCFELFFSQTVFLSQLSLSDKKEIVWAALEKDNIRQQYEHFANSFLRRLMFLFLARTMENSEFEPFLTEISTNETLSDFIYSDTHLITESLKVLIEEYAKLFCEINEQ
jgi:hypothetical protein